MGSAYQTYSEYKWSGIEWLGETPKSWKPIKFGITNSSAELGGNYLAGEGEEGIPVIKMGNLGRGVVNLNKVERLPQHENFDSKHLLKNGDFLFNTRNSLDLVGKVSMWRGELDHAVYNSNVLRITFHDHFVDSTAFMNYLFNSSLGLSQLRLIAKGTTNVAAIYYKELTCLVFSLPPTEEQHKIANFLDHETAKLDALIEKQQQLIKLLKEKRQAVISHAVTKGLNPNAPMRDSGVEWLGEEPAHWGLGCSKWMFRERKTKAHKSDEMLTASQKYGVIPQKEFMRLEQQKIVQVQKGYDILKHVETDDFVISMRSFQGGIEYSSYAGAVSSAYVPLVSVKAICNGYFKYLFKSKQYIQALQSTTNLVRDGQALRYGNFIQVLLPLVPLGEQRAIAEFLNNEIDKIDELIGKAEEGIPLMQERRTALISAAVTGKIDVRNWQAPEPSNANNKEVAP